MANHSRRIFIKNSVLATAGITLHHLPWAEVPLDYNYYSIQQVSELIRTRKISPVALIRSCLKRIQLLNPQLNAFITVTGELALQQAEKADLEISNNKWRGPLHGIPIALKDNIDTAGVKTTAASGVHKNRIPAGDADLVKRLKQAGAIIIGKTNLHEFALGTTSHISYFGAVRNPWNLEYIPGGSSGGSAVAVAAGMCYAAIGTDTGGSNRLPAACCGITGFKPTNDVISTKGIIPTIKSLDHAGVFARTVADAALVLNEIANTHPGACQLNLQASPSPKITAVGIVKNGKASDEVKTLFDKATVVFNGKTVWVESLDLPAELDFIDAELKAYHQPFMEAQQADYSAETLQGLQALKPVDTSVYIRHKEVMEEHRAHISDKLFKDIDVILLPTLTSVPATIAEAKQKGSFALDDANTFPMNYYGLPAISIPCGFSTAGLPLGLQIIGPKWGEQKVIDAASWYQQKTRWHLQHPTF